MTLGDVIEDKYFGSGLTPGDLNSLNLLSNIGNANNTSFSVTEDWLSLKSFTRLAKLAKYANPAQQKVIEDLTIWILKQFLDYTNNKILKNFKQSLQQE